MKGMGTRAALLIAALCAAAACVGSADEHEDYDFYHAVEYQGHEHIDEQHVAELTYENFTEYLEEHKHVMVQFYGDSCHRCKKLKPEYAGAATELAKEWSYKYDVAFAKVDATTEKNLANMYKIEKIPTLLFFTNNGKKRLEYSSELSIEGIVSWVHRRTRPALTEIADQTEFDNHMLTDEAVVMAYIENWDKYDYSAYENLARHDESHRYAVTRNPELASSLGILVSPGLVVFKNFDNGNVVFEGVWDEPNLADFVERETMHVITPFSADREAKTHAGKAFMKAKQSSMSYHVVLFGDRRSVHKTSPIYKILYSVAENFRGKIVFFTVDTDDDGAGMTLDYFGVKVAKKPRIFMLNKFTGKKYEFEGSSSIDKLTKFVNQIMEGKGAEYKKSEPIPDQKTVDDVTVVVGKNFEDVVMDHTKDVFLEVYAHWCGHCKQFAPTYSKLAKRFGKVSSVTVAKMDGTLNEISGLQIKSFPTMYLYKANDKGQPILYEGERDVKAMTHFIMEHSAIPFQMKRKASKQDEL